MVEKYLPIGTVVILKNGRKKLMINGFACKDLDTGDKIYDYSGCVYPEGVLSFDKAIVFDHDQIEKIFYMGYIDEDEPVFKKKLRDGVEELKRQTLEKDEFASGESFDNKKLISHDDSIFKV